MQGEISQWADCLSKAEGGEEIKNIIEGFDLSGYYQKYIHNKEEFEKYIKIVDDEINKVTNEKLPLILDALYTTQNISKFNLFCYLLKTRLQTLPFITRLENHPIHREKFKAFLPTLIQVLGNGKMNWVDDCMWLILLKTVGDRNDEDVFDKAAVDCIEKIIEGNLEFALDYLKKSDFELTSANAYSLEILLDVLGYFPTEKSIVYAIEVLNCKNNAVKLFGAASLLKNNIDVNPTVLEDVAKDVELAYRLLRLLEKNKCANKFPAKYAQQEWIAKSQLVNWLKYPTELGKPPNEIELLEILEKDGYEYYLYKFQTDLEAFKDIGWLFGISGGYKKGEFTSNDTGVTFSKFEPVEDDVANQGYDLIAFMENHWKQRAQELKTQSI